MEDEFLLFVIASFAEKFFRISKNNSSFFLFLLSSLFTVFSIFSLLRSFENGRRKEERSYFVLFPPPLFFSLLSFYTSEERCFFPVNSRIPFFSPLWRREER